MKSRKAAGQNPQPSIPATNRRLFDATLVSAMLLVAVSVGVLFWPAIMDSRQTIFFSDGNVLQVKVISESTRALGGFTWGMNHWLGGGDKTGTLLYPTWLVLCFLPVGTAMWLNMAIHILLAAGGGWFCARQLGIGRWGAAFSGVAFGLTSHFVSLMSPGHLGKLQCIPWFPWVFGFFWKGWQSGLLRHFVFAAMCYAPMWLAGEAQLPYYMGMYLAVLSLWQIVLHCRADRTAACRPVGLRIGYSAICLALTVLLAWQGLACFAQVLRSTTPASVKSPQPAQAGAPQQDSAYEFATSWSFPPEETAVFLTTGKLFGIKSPVYWGRTGTETFKLKQVDDYMGVLVLAMAIVGIAQLRKSRSSAFMLFILLSSLLIAFGRFTPIYRLLYALPTMASQRVPARWIAFSAFAICMLAGIGIDRCREIMTTGDRRSMRRMIALAASMLALGTICLGSWVLLRDGQLTDAMFGTRGSLAMSENMALAGERGRLFVQALASTGLLLCSGAALLASGLWVPRARNPAAAAGIWTVAALCFVAFDLTRNNQSYVEFFDWKQFYQTDSVVDFLKRDPDHFRIQTLAAQQHPYIGRFSSQVGMWHGLSFSEPSTVRELPSDLKPILERLSGRLPYQLNRRFYDLCAVKYVLSALKLPPEVMNEAGLRLQTEIPFSGPPPVYLYLNAGFTPNPAFVSRTRNMKNDDEVVAALADPLFDMNSTVLGVALPETPGTARGEIHVEQFSNRSVLFSTSSDGMGWLVFKQQYDPAWQVTLDGQPQRLYAVNLLHCGIPIPQGKHTVQMAWPAKRRNLLISLGTWMAIGGMLAVWWFRSTRHPARQQ